MGNKISGRLAIWGLRLAVIAPLMMLVAGGFYRLRFVDFQIALLALAVAVLIAAVAALLGLVGAVLGARDGSANTKRAVAALVVALVVLVVPLNTVRQGAGVPMIHDITTDLQDPPIFVEVPRKRMSSDNSLDIDAEVLAAQKAYYTDIGPTMLPMAKAEAFELVREAVEASGWKVHAQKANLGYIEATASTPFFGFRDDVIIRVTEQAGTVRVDMRSASRVGLSDLGVNAGRIRDFMEMIAQ
ncbi:MAG TPA: DUF1499 domain-containing protein [Rhodobiaceae bacterium]|nr:DUF1499 domain-containing protein [Rhodobiaceae bacterium]